MHGKGAGTPTWDISERFSSERACQEYLAGQRWKEGYVCPKCGWRHSYRLKNGRYQCAQCRHQVSVTAGTVLHKTHMPLTQWFLAFYLVCQDKWGISAVQLSAQLGTTYKIAWYMLNASGQLWSSGTKRIILPVRLTLTMLTLAGQLLAKSGAAVRKRRRFFCIIPGPPGKSAVFENAGHAQHQERFRPKIRQIRLCRKQCDPQRWIPQLYPCLERFYP